MKGHFDDCELSDRFHIQREPSWAHDASGYSWVLLDLDTRRSVRIVCPWDAEDRASDVMAAAARHIHNLPATTITIVIDDRGDLVSSNDNNSFDSTEIPWYPPADDFPTAVPRVPRSSLAEIKRVGANVDIVNFQDSQGQTRATAFKYYTTRGNVAIMWHELSCHLRIPAHPNIVPVEAVVVDATTEGPDRAVGFLTTFIPGGNVEDNVERVFKLEYLRQLLATVDWLNHELGIVHGDLRTFNLLVDEETDRIKIMDFGFCGKLGLTEGDVWTGMPGGETAQGDVKMAALTLYEIITGHLIRYEVEADEVDLPDLLSQDWEPDENVRLDHPAAEYRAVLDSWLEARREIDRQITHFSQVKHPVEWPALPPPPTVFFAGAENVTQYYRLRADMVSRGEPFITWARPPSSRLPLPDGQTLLATGQVIPSSS